MSIETYLIPKGPIMNDLTAKNVFGELTLEEVFNHLKDRISAVGVCFLANGKHTPLVLYRQWWTTRDEFVLFERDEEGYERRMAFPLSSKIKIFKEHLVVEKDLSVVKIVFQETLRINLSNFLPEAA